MPRCLNTYRSVPTVMHMRSSAGCLFGLGLAALVVGAGVAGCGSETATDTATGYHLVVRQDGRTLDEFDLARLDGRPR